MGIASVLGYAQVIKDYFASLPDGAKENGTIKTEETHAKNLKRHLGEEPPLYDLTVARVQGYVTKRQKEKGHHGKAIRADTIKKELQTFRQFWHFAFNRGDVSGNCPADAVTLPRHDEKPPFKTWEDIEAIIKHVVAVKQSAGVQSTSCRPPELRLMPRKNQMLRCGLVVLCLLMVAAARGAETALNATGISAPKLLSPPDKMEMTDVASFFRWTPIKNCNSYEIQIGRDAQFHDMVKRKVTKNVRYHEDCYFPREILPPGSYCWRVRAIIAGQEGPWSENCIGTAEGEHFWCWHWERGPEGNISEEDYLRRAWVLCGKYGRVYFWGDGERSSYLWTSASYEPFTAEESEQ